MANLVQQRGETAVLGLDSVPSPVLSSHVNQAIPRHIASLSIPLRDSVSDQEARRAARGVARRKLQRRENARLSSNPHVVRPSASDYALPHPNRHTPSFPLPNHLQHIKLPSQSIPKTNTTNDATSSTAGRFTMTFADAHFFLAHRVGIRLGQECVKEEMGVLQVFAKRAEAEMQAWLHQDVFLGSELQSSTPSTLVDLNSHDDVRDFRIHQCSRNPHNLVWEIPDPFLRLTVHCLARLLQCPTFSKGGNDGHSGRQTWILHPRPGRANANASLSHSMIDTPPTTDIGTDIASDLASEIDSEWAMSDLGEEEESSYDTFDVDSIIEDAVIVGYRIDEEDDSLADVEDG